MKQQISELWAEAAKIIRNRFRLEAQDCPEHIVVSDDCDRNRFGGSLGPNGILHVERRTLSESIPLKGVVLREALIGALPNELCEEARRDIATEFARQNLSKEESAQWVAAWKQIPKVRVHANLDYTSFKMIEWMISLGGESELDSVVHEFLSMAKYGKGLDFEEYVDYLTIRTQEIEVGLDEVDIKIIDYLMKNPTASNKQIGTHLEFSDSWISSRINRLNARHILRKVVSTPFSRIGIRSFYVLLAGPPNAEPWHYLTGCPFLYSLQYILNGPWQVLARLAIPDNPSSVRSLDEMDSILSEHGITADIIETKSAASSNSFYHYNIANSQWEIPWTAMLGWGKRIDEESLHEVIPRIDVPAKTTDMYLDDIDISILNLVNQRVTTTRALRRSLGIGLNRLTKHLRRLRYEGLIRQSWAVHNIGLVESVALRCTSRRASGIIDTWLREFPKVVLHYSDHRDLLAITQLPSGASPKLMGIVRTMGWPTTVSLLGGSVWGQWTFPASLWDVERQRWNSPLDRIDAWLDSIAGLEMPVLGPEKRSGLTAEARRARRTF